MINNRLQYKTLQLIAATGCIHITKLRTVFQNLNLLHMQGAAYIFNFYVLFGVSECEFNLLLISHNQLEKKSN